VEKKLANHEDLIKKAGFLSCLFSWFRPHSRCHHSAWTNGCDTPTVVGLHENWTLALRFQVSGVKTWELAWHLTPETWNPCSEKVS